MFLLNAQLRSCVSIFHDLIANRIFYEFFKIAWSQRENDRWKVWEKKWEKKLNWSQVHADLSNFLVGVKMTFWTNIVWLYRSLEFVSLSTLFLDSINLCLMSPPKIRSFCTKIGLNSHNAKFFRLRPRFVAEYEHTIQLKISRLVRSHKSRGE